MHVSAYMVGASKLIYISFPRFFSFLKQIKDLDLGLDLDWREWDLIEEMAGLIGGGN